jgi:hypothetical protein
LTLPACCVAGALAGRAAALAILVGAALMGTSVLLLARGLAAALEVASHGKRGRWQTHVAFLLRHGAVGLAGWIAISSGLSPAWLVVGVTAWPVALMTEGLRRAAAASTAAGSASGSV